MTNLSNQSNFVTNARSLRTFIKMFVAVFYGCSLRPAALLSLPSISSYVMIQFKCCCCSNFERNATNISTNGHISKEPLSAQKIRCAVEGAL